MFVALGKVTVATAGVPVSILSRLASSQANKLQAALGNGPIHGIYIEALAANTGKVWIGDQDLNKSSGLGVTRVLAIPTSTVFPSFSMALTNAPNALSLSGIYLDVDVGGEAVYITVLVQ
jgi:hypothetical protein